jgi:nitrogen fixation/metabolism regulation signal transduction histidine kinase
VALGVVIALAAAVVGVIVWQPKVGWPEWYTFLWAPALLLVARPAPRWAAIAGTAIVAGTAAALVTWGAEINGRVVAAQRDLARLGDIEDPLAEPLLERLGEQLSAGAEPTAASGMYVLWRASDLAGQEFPVRLALWDRDGTRQAELSLDSLDLPTPLVAALVKGLDSTTSRKVVSLSRVPGRHYVLVQHLPSGRVLTVAVGPRTRLLAPARLARLLRPPSEGPPLYDLSLSPPFARGTLRPPSTQWRREGSEVRTDRLIDLPDGSRHVHAEVQLRPLPLLLVRGALLVSIDAFLLALLWLVATLRLPTVRQRISVRRLARSFQVRLAVTLALFFVVPAVGFTIWGLKRLTAEADRTRDLLITAVLRDAVLTAGSLLQEPSDYLSEGLADLSNRLDADLVLYSGGRLVAASAPLLEDLGLIEPLLDARVYPRMALGDELELTRPATTYVAPVRVGYRVAQSGPPGGVGILATPQLAYDWSRSQDQRELTFLLLLATLGGLGAALLGAQIAARALSRPVAELRRSAAALGQGLPMPTVQTPPAEFEQVFGAFGRMADDVRASQAALDSARQRTAAVLANVATAVVALDPQGAVLLANARARQLLGAALAEGDPFAESLGAGWAPVVTVVNNFLTGSDTDRSTEVEAASRTYRLQLARLGQTPGGSVLALDDLTEVTQAARVLAWGEMARQVAHEIKNPLTPIRLGVQHLRRVRRERPEELDRVLEETSTRILSEIDRLDTIARAFSRFGLPGDLEAALEQVDLSAAAREVAGLYRLTADGTQVDVEGKELVRVPARLDEIKEVLSNLLENARNAGAKRVVIRVESAGFAVQDDGYGIAEELLPRIFEPRFSTTTSGSGLGLAIVRRLVEGWGAAVEVSSAQGTGTTVSIRWT